MTPKERRKLEKRFRKFDLLLAYEANVWNNFQPDHPEYPERTSRNKIIEAEFPKWTARIREDVKNGMQNHHAFNVGAFWATAKALGFDPGFDPLE